MKKLVVPMLLTGMLATAAPTGDWFDAWYQKKYGRPTIAEEKRREAEQASTAFRDVTTTLPAPNWMEQHFKGKLGRYSPGMQAKLDAERRNQAFRAEPAGRALTWTEQYTKAKLGRVLPEKR